MKPVLVFSVICLQGYCYYIMVFIRCFTFYKVKFIKQHNTLCMCTLCLHVQSLGVSSFSLIARCTERKRRRTRIHTIHDIHTKKNENKSDVTVYGLCWLPWRHSHHVMINLSGFFSLSPCAVNAPNIYMYPGRQVLTSVSPSQAT